MEPKYTPDTDAVDAAREIVNAGEAIDQVADTSEIKELLANGQAGHILENIDAYIEKYGGEAVLRTFLESSDSFVTEARVGLIARKRESFDPAVFEAVVKPLAPYLFHDAANDEPHKGMIAAQGPGGLERAQQNLSKVVSGPKFSPSDSLTNSERATRDAYKAEQAARRDTSDDYMDSFSD